MASTTFRAAVLLLLLFFLAASAAPDMSIIAYNKEHRVRGLERSEEEMRRMYDGWLAKHGRAYNALGENDMRFDVFKDNLRFIDAHNAAADAGRHRFRLGLNRFADLTNEEYRAAYLGTRARGVPRRSRVPGDRYRYEDGEELPESVDWRAKGAVAAIKDQGSCGESPLLSLSSSPFPLSPSLAAERSDSNYDRTLGGFEVVSIDGYENIPQNDEKALRKAVANQPVSVAIEAGGRECRTELDHGVVAVGYGTENGEDYWLVRNSWGADWGEAGYIRMERNLNTSTGNMLAIALPGDAAPWRQPPAAKITTAAAPMTTLFAMSRLEPVKW
ncbi:hypothetical protein B296_00024873 [Ensete ventricosum]|uniref:Cathepsin propeptide inhibitor domain-containing protein n=1 Tax=Ensete ventricosum TaxID=4639 RepID=A0A426Z4R1_ENSVE|nr:hypothetical protein B296_00024873 [Ensete ventricosum]